MAKGRLYSVGYEGLDLAGFVASMAQSKVVLVVDVRLNPVSRRPGFSKRRLAQALEEAGIEYLHEPRLGNPPSNRADFSSDETVVRARRRFRRRLENGAGAAVERIVQRARRDRVAVMCVERASASCHRLVITDYAAEIAPDLTVREVL